MLTMPYFSMQSRIPNDLSDRDFSDLCQLRLDERQFASKPATI